MNIIEARKICKSFGGISAVSDVDFKLRKGEIHSIIGENGAGKSTFIKMISGDHMADSGTITFEGRQVKLTRPEDATSLGIRTIYQEFNLIPTMSVAENIFLGDLPVKNKVVSWPEMYQKAHDLLARLGLDIDSRINVSELTVAEQQMVEICKALSKDMKVLILDEPTAALNENESQKLFTLIRTLSSQGVSIIYISHYLNEIMDISERISVFRDGRKVTTVNKEDTKVSDLVTYIVGHEMGHQYKERQIELGETILDVNSITNNYLTDVSFQVKSKEIVGLYGLLGAGQLEICRTLFGDLPIRSGEVKINNKPVSISSPIDAMKNGIGLVPSDRKNEGLMMNMSVGVNSTFSGTYLRSKKGIIDFSKEREIFEKLKQDVRIKTTGYNQNITDLSGGNQQKTLISRWMDYDSSVLILADPTRGVDIGAKSEIYDLLYDFCNLGKAVLFMSSDLPEVLGVADRLILFSDGRILTECSCNEVSQADVLNMLNTSEATVAS
ncbi:MAG: sugar ABC transporter ATP-binding protein [Saccharofermentanales bacterium]|jgi:ribose transport system ATP-binding protein